MMREVTDAQRWQISSRITSFLTVLYGTGLERAEGERGNERAEEIWLFCGKEMAELIGGSGPAPRSAGELAVHLTDAMRIVFGTEYRSEVIEIEEERAVILMRSCPCLMRAAEMGERPSVVFHVCLPFAISVVESLKKEFSARFVKGMCMGDRNCEILIAPRQSLEARD